MASFLAILLLTTDPVTEAGMAYRQALQALQGRNYEEAVQLLRGALQKLGEETEDLKYRDGVARQRHSYYPYYEWAHARQLQAQGEASIFTRRDLLKEALSRLAQTRHPEASQLIDGVKAQLATVEKAIELDGSFSSAKTRIEVLGTGERFEEAFKQLEAASTAYLNREKEFGDLRGSLKERQAALEKRYQQLLTQRLADVALTDPVSAGESISGILKPAQIPPEALAHPGPPFQWLQKFLDLWEKNLEIAHRAPELSAEDANGAAGAFESIALESLVSDVPTGFRAARHIAHAIRLAKLNRIATGSEDTIDIRTAAVVLQSARETSARASAALGGIPEGDAMLKTLENDVPARQKQIEDLSKKITDGDRERTRLTSPILQAEASLADGNTLGDVVALTKLKNDLFELESDAMFGTLTARLRARALMGHALAEAMLGFMEGNPPARVVDRCRVPAWRAYGFDPKVDARYSRLLSPKLLKILEQIKPQ
jgi:hypothetical protein